MNCLVYTCMKEKIQEIIKNEHISNADFAEKIGISPAAVSSILKGRNNPSMDVVKRILQAYPKINWSWLVFGKGDMYNQENGKVEKHQPNLFENALNPTNDTLASEYRKEIESKGQEIASRDIVKQEIRYIEKPSKKITEIRIFFDDNTYEIFRPEK